jgi:hypothetical protein
VKKIFFVILCIVYSTVIYAFEYKTLQTDKDKKYIEEKRFPPNAYNIKKLSALWYIITIEKQCYIIYNRKPWFGYQAIAPIKCEKK